MNPIQWILSLLKSLLTFIFPPSSDRSIYGLDHAVLNIPAPPPSMWMNMGYWKDETNLPGACRALLDQVLIAAGFLDSTGHPVHTDRQVHLLDVGIGCGDQTMHLVHLLKPDHQAPSYDRRDATAMESRPLFDSYVGITLLPEQADLARQRLEASSRTEESNAMAPTNTGTPIEPTRVDIFCADGADPASWNKELQRAVVSSPVRDSDAPTRTTTWLLALDTLYHFRPSRAPLLRYANTELHASFMAFDLLLSDTATLWQRLLLRGVCMMTGAPFANFLTRTKYEALLVRAGYAIDDIAVTDISEDVFGGLAGFIRQKDARLRRMGMSVGGKFRGAATVFDWWARSGVVRGVVVVARLGGQ
ncbi:hypothetical protein P170DRAFT_431999 [Aspergillus steynii IBT 23096]|uniref:S-adenosyl-L-methionine-dependent methyltransferase n=1 Tax=Aspergillus steynii IBT 23096 TaxID=1392250 RepID=A0A2I2GND1_9EURO|nr:uncharacterized protein P170DRAFT_431999 [Aspergillus steynii IBT 23096]PLB54370.1 hypothetical protein P170DRAFT_431999 [Aspergillus steynii IBT 23096]